MEVIATVADQPQIAANDAFRHYRASRGDCIVQQASAYEFSTDWFTPYIGVWNQLVGQIKPKRLLEIGSFEGRSACYLIEKCTLDHAIEIHCVDTWEDVIGFDFAMNEVEARFDRNTALAQGKAQHPVTLLKHKQQSKLALANLLTPENVGSFDLVYVDGSHQAPDVLTDAVLAFPLLRVGGLMVFDDYLWCREPIGKQDPLNMPKPAIDAFLNLFQRKIRIVRGAPLYQIYVIKVLP